MEDTDAAYITIVKLSSIPTGQRGLYVTIAIHPLKSYLLTKCIL